MIHMKELAEYLKSERLKQGLALQEMSERVRVSIGMLEALEEGRLRADRDQSSDSRFRARLLRVSGN